MTSDFPRNVKNGNFGRNPKKNRKTTEVAKTTTTIVARKTTTKNRQIERVLVETAPSCNDCVATIVARPFTLTVKGGNQPSVEEIRVLFPRIQESGGVLRLELKLFKTNF